MKILNGCISKGYEEIDGKEFEVSSLEELVAILKRHKQVHLTYFKDEEDLDLWLDIN